MKELNAPPSSPATPEGFKTEVSLWIRIKCFLSTLRACLHRDRVTLFRGSPFYKGQKIAPLYMQSLVPRVIAIIESGAKGDNWAVAKYKTTKMAEKRSILALNSIFPCVCLFGCGFFSAVGSCCRISQLKNVEFRDNLTVILSRKSWPF